jgi:hypothetical protein
MSQRHLASAALPVHTAQERKDVCQWWWLTKFRRDDGQGSSDAVGDIREGDRPQKPSKPTLF